MCNNWKTFKTKSHFAFLFQTACNYARYKATSTWNQTIAPKWYDLIRVTLHWILPLAPSISFNNDFKVPRKMTLFLI